MRVVAPRPALDRIEDGGVAQRLGDHRLGHSLVPHRDVLADGALAKEDVLIDRGHRVGEILVRPLLPQYAVEPNLARTRTGQAPAAHSNGRIPTHRNRVWE